MADQSALYEGLRVVEHGCDPATEFSGKLLAQFGADVIKIETLDGPSSRLEAPLRGDESLHFEYYNAAKRSLLVEAHDLLRILDKVLDRADVFLIGLHPDDLDQTGLDLPALCHRHDRLVVTAITPFGLDGPWARYRSSDLVALAAGGLLNNCGYDDLRIPPIRPAGNQAYHLTASHALMAVMLALLDRARSERGQLLDVSIHATVAVNTEMTSLYWLYQGELVRRQTCRAASPMPTAPAIMRCADGLFVYFLLILAEPKAWSTLVDWLTDDGFAADLGDPIFRDVAHRQSHFDHIYGIIEAFCLVHEAQWVYLEGQRRGLPIGIVNAPEDLLGDEHLQARSFFKPVKQSDGSEITFPGPVCSFSTWPFTSDRRAPSPGEHTEDIQRELGGTV